MTAKEKEFAKRQEKLEKEEEFRKKMKQLTRFATQLEELSERMEKGSERMYLEAKENAIKGLNSDMSKNIEMSAKMKAFSYTFKTIKNRVDICIIMIEALNVIFPTSVKIPEEFSKDLQTYGYNYNHDGLSGIDNALFDLETNLEINFSDKETDYPSEIDCCNRSDESHKLIVEELKQRLMMEISTDTLSLDDSIVPEADAFTKKMLEETEDDNSSEN